MGLLDSIAGQVLGGGNQANLVNGIVGLLGNQSGGLTGLVQQFAAKGLGDVVNSWVSTGQNLPITPQQVQQALGSDTVNKLASQAGVSTDQLASHLTSVLPNLVDKLTPNGQIPQGDIASQGLKIIQDLFK